MLEHSFDIVPYVGVRHPHNPEAFASQPVCSTLIILLLLGMCFAIDFHHQLRLGAEEVGDEGA